MVFSSPWWSLRLSEPKKLQYSLSKMRMSTSRLCIYLLFLHLFILQLSPRISAIRWWSSPEISFVSIFCILSLLVKKQRTWDQNVECCVNGAKFLVYVVQFLSYLNFDGLPILGMWHFSFGVHTIISTQKLKKENFRKTLLLMRVWKCES